MYPSSCFVYIWLGLSWHIIVFLMMTKPISKSTFAVLFNGITDLWLMHRERLISLSNDSRVVEGIPPHGLHRCFTYRAWTWWLCLCPFLVNGEVTNPNQDEGIKLLNVLSWELQVLDNYAIYERKPLDAVWTC